MCGVHHLTSDDGGLKSIDFKKEKQFSCIKNSPIEYNFSFFPPLLKKGLFVAVENRKEEILRREVLKKNTQTKL